MTFHDKITMPFGNLWRTKLRSTLTIGGVTIAIGAFVAMLSFGAGNQQYITDQFNQLGLLSTMYVYPRTEREQETQDTTRELPLNDSIIGWLGSLPGVQLAYPYSTYEVTVAGLDTTLRVKAMSVPMSATQTRMFSQVESGRLFDSDSAREVVVTTEFLRQAKIDTPESAIGKEIILSVDRIRLDSGLVQALRGSSGVVERVFVKGWLDSVRQASYLRRIVQNEMGQALSNFAQGFFDHPATISDTLTIVGVLKRSNGHGRFDPVMMPTATAERFASGGLSSDPMELFAGLRDGSLVVRSNVGAQKSYPRATLQLDPMTPFKPIKDSVEAHGFRSYSYAEEFEQITKFFIYFDMALALVGMIALITASLGIVNTMVMSIMERRREIGVLKALGASESDIKVLFLFESALIGFVGSVAGIVLGWLVSRVSSAVAQYFMAREGFDEVELFALPWWLVLQAIAFGLLVSIAAGAWPAARAARTDPVEALRAE